MGRTDLCRKRQHFWCKRYDAEFILFERKNIHYFQVKQHEDRIGCNKSSKYATSATSLPVAMGDLTRILLSHSAAVPVLVTAASRLRRAVCKAAPSTFGVEDLEVKRLLPESPERSAKKAKARRSGGAKHGGPQLAAAPGLHQAVPRRSHRRQEARQVIFVF